MKRAKDAIKMLMMMMTSFFLSILSTIIPIILAIVAIAAVLFVIAGLVHNLSNGISRTENNSPAYSEIGGTEFESTLYDLYYKKHADEAYYYNVSEPETDDTEYSGKTYDEIVTNQYGEASETILGIEGINQSSWKQPIRDVDNFEKNLTIEYTTLQELDKKLNGHEKTTTGGSYVPQLVKPVYSTCDLEDKETNIKDCESKSLTKVGVDNDEHLAAESYEYIDNEDGTYTQGENKTISTSDYGLGSLLHYQAHYEPSQVVNFHIDSIEDLKEGFKYGESEPIQVIPRHEITMKMIENFNTEKNDFLVPPNEPDVTGYYWPESQFTYKDWYKNYIDSKGGSDASIFKQDPEQWKKADPTINTGIPETTVSFAIDKAITMYGDFDFNVANQWVDVGETYGYQKTYKLKKFEDRIYEPLKIKYNKATNLRELHKNNGEIIGYADADSKGEFIPARIREVKVISDSVKETQYRCCDAAGACSSWSSAKPAVCKGKIETGSNNVDSKPGSDEIRKSDLRGKSYYGSGEVGSYVKIKEDQYLLEPARIRFKAFWDKNKNPVDHIDLEFNDKFAIEHKEAITSNEISKTGYFNPYYIFHLNAKTSGDLQTRRAFHSSLAAVKNEDDILKYLKDYLYYYEAYAPYKEKAFTCKDDSGSITSSEQTVADINQCSDESYAIATEPNKTTFYPSLSFKNMSTKQFNKLKELLKYTELQKFDTQSINETSLEFGTKELTVDSSLKKTITNIANKYGVDPKILSLVLNANNFKVIPGKYSGYDYSEGIFEKNKTITLKINSNKEEAIQGTAILLQNLGKDYNGNVPVMLTVYDLAFQKGDLEQGEEEFEKVVELYKSITGISKNVLIDEKNNISWYHCLINASTFEDGTLPGNHLTQYLKENIVRVSIPNKGTTSWSRLNLRDNIESSVSDTQLKSIYYLFVSLPEEEKEKVWKYLTYGIENLESGVWAKDGTVNLKQQGDIYHKLEKGFNFTEVDEVLTTALTKQTGENWNDLYSQIKEGKGDFVIQRMGDLAFTLKAIDIFGPSYILDNPFSEKPKTQKNEVDSTWFVELEKEQKIKSPFTGDVTFADGITIEITNEDTEGKMYKKAKMLITGVKPTVKKDDKVENGTEIGTADGKVSIEFYVWNEDEEPYQIPYNRIFESYEVGLEESMWNTVYAAFANMQALCGETERIGQGWMEIYNNAHAIGWESPNGQCTTFTNGRLYEVYGPSINKATGNGNVTASNAVAANPDVFELQQDGDPKSGSVFSWLGGEYGHTGFIDLVDVEKDRIVVSEGNIFCEGYNSSVDAWPTHCVRNYNVYKLSEWKEKNKGIMYAVPKDGVNPNISSKASAALSSCQK